jgi:hypothetical protein
VRGRVMSTKLAGQWLTLMLLLILAGCLGGCCGGPQGSRDFAQASKGFGSRDFWDTQERSVKPGI